MNPFLTNFHTRFAPSILDEVGTHLKLRDYRTARKLVARVCTNLVGMLESYSVMVRILEINDSHNRFSLTRPGMLLMFHGDIASTYPVV